MTYAILSGANGHTFSVGASGGSTTPAIDTTGADLIVAGVVYSSGHVATLTDSKSNSWTAIGSARDSGFPVVQLYYSQAPTAGSGHTFTVTGSSSFSSVFIEAFSGSAASPLDQNTGNAAIGGSFTIASGSITPTQDSELICVMYGNGGTAASQAMNSGMTLTDTQSISGPTWGSSMGYKIQTTAAAINVTGSTGNAASNAIVIASFKAAGVIVAIPVGATSQSYFVR